MPSYSVEFERLWARRAKSLGRDLTQEEARVHTLFRGLIARRVKAFHSWWPRTRTNETKFVIAGTTLNGTAAEVVVKVGFTGKLIVITAYVC